ncbi:hypothetical protein SAMN05421837_1011360 [Amycolatopsis pretoriensis]|uniref:Serine/threonine protein kinase n=1 Tax=Amycolatopsis pretoriensis TaxID=218821 RepID=A0A1H5QAY1_9PSEU|nr:hypothetical protein [Amycolatopsis pretoriensis]SEF22397.1 hypothetical protein SAMN05421837_1011360 [Amycolatopsis pretoriensis]
MPHPTTTRTWRPLLAACLAVPALAACSAEQAAQGPASSAPPSTSAAPASSTTAPPPPPATGGSSAPAPATKPSGAPPSVPGSCGTVTAASGLTLYVFDSGSAGVTCVAATKLVGDFHRKIAGHQGAGSNDAVNETVDGWLCTSGPPAAQGGTTCTKGEQTVFAAVVPSE